MNRKSWVISGTRFLAESLFRIRLRGRRMSSSFSACLIGMIEARVIRDEDVLVTANMLAAIERLAFKPRTDLVSQPAPVPRPDRLFFGPTGLRVVAAPPSPEGVHSASWQVWHVLPKWPPHVRLTFD